MASASSKSPPPAEATSGAGSTYPGDAKFDLLSKAPTAVVESPHMCSLGRHRERSAVPAALDWRMAGTSEREEEAPARPFCLAIAATGGGPARLERTLSHLVGSLDRCKGVLVAIPQSGGSTADTRRLSEAAFKALAPAKLPEGRIEVRVMPPGSHGHSATTDGRAVMGIGVAMAIGMADRVFDGLDEDAAEPVLVVLTDAVVPDRSAISVMIEGAAGVADYASGIDTAELLAPLGPKDSPLVRDGAEMCRVTRGPQSYWRTTQCVHPRFLAARMSVWKKDAKHWTTLAARAAEHPHWHWKKLLETRHLVASIPEVGRLARD